MNVFLHGLGCVVQIPQVITKHNPTGKRQRNKKQETTASMSQ